MGISFSERMKRGLIGQGSSWDFQLGTGPQFRPQAGEVETQVKIGEPLGQDERGAVWPALAGFVRGPGMMNGDVTGPNHEDLRTALLFFDRFDVPGLGQVSIGHHDGEELERIGVRTSTTAYVNGDIATALCILPFATFMLRDQMEPGRWALSRPAQAFGIPEKELSDEAGFAMVLQNALPVFTRDVGLEEVLQFKHRRWAELLALRAHMDDICIEVASNGVNGFQQSIAFERFDRALADHVKTMAEGNLPKVWRSLQASVDWTAAIPALGPVMLGETISAGGILGGAAAIGFKTIRGLRRKRSSANPFEYLTSAHLEL